MEPAGIDSRDDVLAALRAGHRFLVVAHARPDGDAIGSMLACSMLLQQLGKQVELVSADRVPPHYCFLPCASSIQHRAAIEDAEEYDAVVLLECDGIERSRLRGLSHRPLINIDHHASGVAFAGINWIDPTANAVAEMIHTLAGQAGIAITPEMATCLYTALLTDTGAFCYPGTAARTFALAGTLVSCGADPAAIAAQVYFSSPAAKMRLLGAALSTLRVEGSLAQITITRQDLDRCQATDEDTEGLVNYAIGIDGVQTAVFLRELGSGRVRLSLRSKEAIGPDAQFVDVAAIAALFGGGGHRHASGCSMPGPLAEATAHILQLVGEERFLAR
ncbi:MAG TPA: bifunctional oligoribonuclease/PAP phosphatase NrnA [Acidobacteriaceae bacterium]